MDLLQGLAEGNERVDLILGGHDHDLVVHGDNLVFQDGTTTSSRDIKGDVKIVKSGTDFKSLSIVKVPVRRKTHSRGVDIGEVHGEHLLSRASYQLIYFKSTKSSTYPPLPTQPTQQSPESSPQPKPSSPHSPLPRSSVPFPRLTVDPT